MMFHGLEFTAESYNGNGDGANGECECAELLIRGKRVPPPVGHDCAYVRERTALVKQAVTIAKCKGDRRFLRMEPAIRGRDERAKQAVAQVMYRISAGWKKGVSTIDSSGPNANVCTNRRWLRMAALKERLRKA